MVEVDAEGKPVQKPEPTRAEMALNARGSLQDAFTGAMDEFGKALDIAVIDEGISVSWIDAISKIGLKVREAGERLVELFSNRKTAAVANKEAFLVSDEHKHAMQQVEGLAKLGLPGLDGKPIGIDTVEVTRVENAGTPEEKTVTERVPNPDNGGLPEPFYSIAFEGFKKPYDGQGPIPLWEPSIEPKVDISQLGRPETVKTGRPPQGHTADDKVRKDNDIGVDKLNPNRKPTSLFNLYARAFVAETEVGKMLPDSCREESAGLYTHINPALEKLFTDLSKRNPAEAKRLFPRGTVRGMVSKWGHEQKMPDKTERFVRV